jgi:hypothetical protein
LRIQKYLFSAVPLWGAASNKYDHKIYNYSIDEDPLSESVVFGVAVRVGRDMPSIPMQPFYGPDKIGEEQLLLLFSIN